MSIELKKIRGHVYEYEVTWDKVRKRNVYRSHGRVDKPASLPDLTKEEEAQFVAMLRWIIRRPAGQGGCAYHDIAEILMQKLESRSKKG